MFQIKHGPSSEIVTDLFTQATQEYNFRKNRDCRIYSVNTVLAIKICTGFTIYVISVNTKLTSKPAYIHIIKRNYAMSRIIEFMKKLSDQICLHK